MKNVFFAYIKEKTAELLLFTLFVAVFTSICFLYRIEAEAYFYAILLCVLLGLLFFTVGLVRCAADWKQRQTLMSAIEHNWQELPPPHALSEEDYQQMVRALGQRCAQLETDFQTQQQESLDYYTTWVHQIKTPISVMQMLLQGEDTQTNRALSAELFRIQQYVDMVLGYIRLGSESSDFVFQEYPLDSLIRQTIRKFAPQFIHRRIRLAYLETDAVVLTDEKWLCFVLEQLLSNTVKYTAFGEVTISVSPDQVLTIRDTGMGIASEDLPRVFEKGFTGYNGRSGQKSTGLGLYLCKRVCEKLGHRITIESQVGKGTAVSIHLGKKALGISD